MHEHKGASIFLRLSLTALSETPAGQYADLDLSGFSHKTKTLKTQSKCNCDALQETPLSLLKVLRASRGKKKPTLGR